MLNGSSFIDMVVLDPIREHFVSGSVLALADEKLEHIIWCNAAGARAFASANLIDAMGAATSLSIVQKRQILSGLDSGKANMVRIGAQLVAIEASKMMFDDGDVCILLSAPNALGQDSQKRRAQGMIDGLEDAQSRAAVLNHNGAVIAATSQFMALDISGATINSMILDVSHEEDRLIKRPIPTARGQLPSAIARLDCEDLHLLMVVVPVEASPFAEKKPDPAKSLVGADKPKISEPSDKKAEEEKVEALAPEFLSAPILEGEAPASFEQEQEADPSYDEIMPEGKDIEDDHEDEAEAASFALPLGPLGEKSQKRASLPQTTQRFVWKTDRDGALVEMSEAFTELLDADNSQILARSFTSVIDEIGIDTQKVEGLMARQDTWSGQRITLGLNGRDIAVPVILSALPQRDRDNQFVGYRGFGLIRYEEAVPLIRHVEAIKSDEPASGDDAPTLTEITELAERTDAPDDLEGTIEATPDEDSPDQAEAHFAAEISDDHEETAIEAETTHHAGNLNDKERAAFEAIRKELTDKSLSAANKPAEPEAQADNIVPLELGKNQPENKPDNRTAEIVPRFMPSAFAAMELLPKHGNIELSALDQIPLAVMLQRGDDIVYANERFLNLSGFDDVSDIIANGGLDGLFEEPEADALSLEHEDSARAVMRVKTPNGEGIDAEAHIQVINFEGKRALLLALVPITPVETLRESESDDEPAGDILAPAPLLDSPASANDLGALRAQVEELHSILDTATDGVILLDGVANIRSINKSAEALFGYENETVRGRPFTTLFAIESHRGAMEYLTALTENGVASVLNDGREVIGREKEGRFIPLFMTLGRLAGSNGYCAVLRDITPWKRAEENLNLARQDAEAASTQKSAFLARISHEIRTPLNAIIGFSDLMLDERFGSIKDERSREYLKDINKSGSLVLDLVNDLLDLSKIEAGEQELDFAAVSINELLRESVSMMQPKANQQRVIIRSSLSAELPEVVADARSIKQIALNLLSNAVRFTKAGGQVVVSSALQDNGCVAIRIRDTGIGMTEDQIDHAMQPFKQVPSEDALATKDGSGLGLPLTKAMVEGNRAEMFITSTPNVGTIVEVIFPSNRVLQE